MTSNTVPAFVDLQHRALGTITNLSSCVATLASGADGDIMLDHAGRTNELRTAAEQAFELAAPIPDYEQAARDAGWEPDGERGWVRRVIGVNGSHIEGIATSAQVICEDYDIEPHDREVYEHWAVPAFLADQIEKRGEKVGRGFMGHDVWCRTRMGPVEYDTAICHIRQKLEDYKLAEDPVVHVVYNASDECDHEFSLHATDAAAHIAAAELTNELRITQDMDGDATPENWKAKMDELIAKVGKEWARVSVWSMPVKS